MCGISGLLSTKIEKTAMVRALQDMQSALTHRGPDDKGHYYSPSEHAALSHTRLAVIDLSVKAVQPMSIDNGRYTISFNGEIYNYESLREELINDNVEFISHSDTEVIVRLYARLGPACVSRLRGMFAFVIWDEQEQHAFAARDPFGIKPFYYWKNSHSMVFASEVRSVIASGFSCQTLCADGAASYFKTGSIAEPNTIIDDIKMLPAGHHLRWQAGQVDIQCFWEPQFMSQQMNRADATKITRRALEDSIKAHLVSDVPIGIFLSGGIDSSVLVALASRLSQKKLNTYSIAFTDPQWNEGELAKRIANHFGTQHTEFLMTAERAKPLFAQYLEAIDQPTIDGFNTFCVARLAGELGEKVVLSGLGADELFAGYKSFELLPKMVRVSKLTAIVAPLIKHTTKTFNRFLTPRTQRILDFLSAPNSLSQAHQSLRGVFSNSETNTLLNNYKLAQQTLSAPSNKLNENDEWLSTQAITTKLSLADSISQIELSTYMRNQLLRDSDVTSMASGLELRVPFVDQVLFDTLASIPSKWRLEPGKKLLIDSVPELPLWVSSRKKQGFRFPFDKWYCNTWFDDSALRANQAQQHSIPNWVSLTPWYRHWNLTVLNDWFNRHGKQID